MLCNKCSESRSNWDELEPIQVCPQRQEGHGGRAGTQLCSLLTAEELQTGRAERQTAAAGGRRPHQSATDGSAYSGGTGTDTRTKTWGLGPGTVLHGFCCHHKIPQLLESHPCCDFSCTRSNKASKTYTIGTFLEPFRSDHTHTSV